MMRPGKWGKRMGIWVSFVRSFFHLLILWGSFSDDITTTGIGLGELNACCSWSNNSFSFISAERVTGLVEVCKKKKMKIN